MIGGSATRRADGAAEPDRSEGDHGSDRVTRWSVSGTAGVRAGQGGRARGGRGSGAAPASSPSGSLDEIQLTTEYLRPTAGGRVHREPVRVLPGRHVLSGPGAHGGRRLRALPGGPVGSGNGAQRFRCGGKLLPLGPLRAGAVRAVPDHRIGCPQRRSEGVTLHAATALLSVR